MMEKAILSIVLIVALVGIVGLLSSTDFSTPSDALGGGLTGNVVATPEQCGSCAGYAPVCAKINNRYLTFDNECSAVCAGASVAAQVPCERLPQTE